MKNMGLSLLLGIGLSGCFTSGSYLSSNSSNLTNAQKDIQAPSTTIPTTTLPTLVGNPPVVLTLNASTYYEPTTVLAGREMGERVGFIWNIREVLEAHYGGTQAVVAAAQTMAQQNTLGTNFFEIVSTTPQVKLRVPASDIFYVVSSSGGSGTSTLFIRNLIVVTSNGGADSNSVGSTNGRTVKFYSVTSGYPTKEFFGYLPMAEGNIGSLMLVGGKIGTTLQNRITGVQLGNDMGILPENWGMGLLPAPLTSDGFVLKNLSKEQLCLIYVKYHNYVNSAPSLRITSADTPAVASPYGLDCTQIKAKLDQYRATPCVPSSSDPNATDTNRCALYAKINNPIFYSIYENQSAIFAVSKANGKVYELRAILPSGAPGSGGPYSVSICSITSLTTNGSVSNPCGANNTASGFANMDSGHLSQDPSGTSWQWGLVRDLTPTVLVLSSDDIVAGRVLSQ